MIILAVDRQAEIFLFSLFCGICAAFLYDMLKTFRLMVSHTKIAEYTEDCIYWLFCAFVFFSFMLKNNSGEVRFFSICAFFAAIIIYNLTLGKTVSSLSAKIVYFLKKTLKLFCEIICTPFKLLWTVLKKPVFFIGKKAEKKLRTVLILIQKYVKIKSNPSKTKQEIKAEKRGLKNGKKSKQKR